MKPTEQDISSKADGAYKTISEVAEELEVPTHVLRFWESRFPQVKPQRMRGGRRYYRPGDVETLKKIKTLLYAQGYTIKGARKHVKDKTHDVHSEVVAAQKPSKKAVVQAASPVPQAQEVPKAAAQKKPEISKLISELRDLKKSLALFTPPN